MNYAAAPLWSGTSNLSQRVNKFFRRCVWQLKHFSFAACARVKAATPLLVQLGSLGCNGMADRKRRRATAEDMSALRRVLHTGGITINGLSSLLESVRGSDLQCTGVHNLRDANAELSLAVRHTIQLPLIAGGTWEWELADPNKLLQVAIDRSPFLQGLFAAAVRRSRPTAACPWRLVIGFDEFTPGLSASCVDASVTSISLLSLTLAARPFSRSPQRHRRSLLSRGT